MVEGESLAVFTERSLFLRAREGFASEEPKLPGVLSLLAGLEEAGLMDSDLREVFEWFTTGVESLIGVTLTGEDEK